MKFLSDIELVVLVQEGNIIAFEQLIVRYQKRLLSYVSHIMGEQIHADDVVQEVFFSLYKTIDRVDINKKFSSYVYVIAKNIAISYMRKRKPHVSLNELIIGQEDEEMYKLLEIKEEQVRIQLALKKLPSKYRQVIILYYFEDIPYEGIAKKMKLPLNTVRTYLKRAKESLRGILYEEN